jgi:CDP-paratose 2-epimerase
MDVRSYNDLDKIYQKYNSDIKLIIHTASQPSHDWAAQEPLTDFTINANGTLNLLELTRKYCPNSVFIFTSTNKVYGDSPNSLPFQELDKRFELEMQHPYYNNGIDEGMSIDQSLHSLFGASKLAADILVQEYGKYYEMYTGVFRGGCLTGSNHSGTELHGFLAYLMKCALLDKEYNIFGYKGKQVRDNIHSFDLIEMFWHYYKKPQYGEVYNVGGSRYSNSSILEAIELIEDITGKVIKKNYIDDNRIGDHIWWISDISKFQTQYPSWDFTYDLIGILNQIFIELKVRI